ncbi:hypothetical protein Tco_1442124 [Tanacetum coccineum]
MDPVTLCTTLTQGLSKDSCFISHGDYTHFYRLSHSELVDIEKVAVCSSLRSLKSKFYTSAGNPVKDILLKLNLPNHRKLKDGGEGMSMSVQSHKFYKMAKFIKMAKRLCLVDDLKMLKITMSNTSSRNKLNPEINDHYNILTGECQKDELKTKDKALYARLKVL